MTECVRSIILTFVKPTVTVTFFFKIIWSKRKKPKQNCKFDTYSSSNHNFDRLILLSYLDVQVNYEVTMATVFTAMLLKFAFFRSFSILTNLIMLHLTIILANLCNC